MTITREQVADLQPGDVVEYGNASYGWTITGALWKDPDGTLRVGSYSVRYADGNPSCLLSRTLTVVSRAPRPLYVNHDRTEPVPGDVVRDADSDDPKVWFVLDASGIQGAPWASWGAPDYDEGITWDWFSRDELPARLRLLVDGETGQVVPS